MSTAVTETELHWRKAEPFFRTKQKRGAGGVDSRSAAQQEFPRLGGKARKVVPVVPMKLTPVGGDIVRPSLIPKAKPSLKASSKVSVNRKRSPSESPDQVRTGARPKICFDIFY